MTEMTKFELAQELILENLKRIVDKMTAFRIETYDRVF